MMKMTVLICMVLAAACYFLPIPVSQTKSITIHASYEKVSNKVNNLKSWKEWLPVSEGSITLSGDTLLQTPAATYLLTNRQPLSITLHQQKQDVYHIISVAPAAGDTMTTVSWKQYSYLHTAIALWIQSLQGGRAYSTAKLLYSLKKFVEDPVKYYGFKIGIEQVTDTIVLVKQIECSREAIPRCLEEAFDVLRLRLSQSHYTGRAEQMFHIDTSSPGAAHVMVGISIDSIIQVKAPFVLMTMPRAHIVTGYYRGDYKNIGRLHEAMVLFLKDKKVSMVAVPYEKMLSEPRTALDSQHVSVKVYHPAMLY